MLKHLISERLNGHQNIVTFCRGPMPHSGVAKGEYSSIISAIESEAGYPPVVKMGTDGLKITKTSFRNTLEYLLTEKNIA